MIKLNTLLKEIGEGTLTPYTFTVFNIDKGDKVSPFRVEYKIQIDKNISIEVSIAYSPIYADSYLRRGGIHSKLLDILKKHNITYKNMSEYGCYSVDFNVSKDTYNYLKKSDTVKAQYINPVYEIGDYEGMIVENFLSMGQVLRLITTIVYITKQFDIKYNKNPFHLYKFTAQKTEDESSNNRRFDLYAKFIEKNSQGFETIKNIDPNTIFLLKI